MQKIMLTAALTAILGFGTALSAQGGGGFPGGGGGRAPGAGGGGGQGGGQGGNWGKGNDQWKKNDNPGGGQGGAQGGGQGQGGDDWMKRAMENIGWGENGDEERVLPGDSKSSADKEAWLEVEANKLGLMDEGDTKKARKEFIKLGKKAWDASEKEDKRWHSAWKRTNNNAESLAKEKEKHHAALRKCWEDCDADLKKKELLNDEKLAEWIKDTEPMRAESATDKSIRQDEIRARKVGEIRKQAEDWRKANSGGAVGGNEGKEKKEKKEEEGAEKEAEKKEEKKEEGK